MLILRSSGRGMSGSTQERRELWTLAREGHAASREELCRLAHEIAERELRRRGVRSVELADLAQECVRSTLANLAAQPAPPAQLRPYLKFRAWGVLSDHRKRARSRPPDPRSPESDARPDPGPGPAQRCGDEELARALAECSAALDPALRAVIELRYDARRGTEAIARELGIHRNTVHVRLFRALEHLRKCLDRVGHRSEAES